MLDYIVHKWLKVPYTLHIDDRKPKGKARATLVFIHGIGNSGHAWDEVIAKMPDDVRTITVDLLGFGQSPRPSWAVYDARRQARSVLATLLALRITGKVILVGHSLGSLVAVEIAKRYPLLVQSLVLCSPPFYRPDPDKPPLLPSSDYILKGIYKRVKQRPEQFVQLSSFAVKYGLAGNKSFNVTNDNVATYMATLETAIVNQTSLEDARRLPQPIHIIRGTLDPLVVGRNLKDLAKLNDNVTLTTIIAGHEVVGIYVPSAVKAIKKALPPVKKRATTKK